MNLDGNPAGPMLIPTPSSLCNRRTRACMANLVASPMRASYAASNSSTNYTSLTNDVKSATSISRVVRIAPHARFAKPPMNANRQFLASRNRWS